MSSGGGYKTKSAFDKSQTGVMKNMYEIFKNNLGRQLPGYPGSSGVTPFTQQQVQQDYRGLVGQPVADMWQKNLLGLVGADARNYAGANFQLMQNAMSAQAGRQGEQNAYKEWLRVQPETGQGMRLGQAFLGTSPEFQYQTPSSSNQIASGILAGGNALGQYALMQSMNSTGLNSGNAWAGMNNPQYGNITSPWAYTRNIGQ